MSFTDERLAIINRLLAEVPFIPTQFPNTATFMDANLTTTGTPKDQLWRRVTILRGSSTPYTAGRNGKDEQSGVIDIDVFAPMGSGDIAATAHADAIASAMKWQNLEQNGFCLHTRTVTVTPQTAADTWYHVKVSIEFRSYPKRS